MNLNFTLIIQAGNFFIAYILLRTILLKPAVEVMRQQEEEQGLLRGEISRNQLLIEEKKQVYRQQWLKLQEFYADFSPSFLKTGAYIFKNISPRLEYPTVSDTLIKQLADQTADLLAQKLVE